MGNEKREGEGERGRGREGAKGHPRPTGYDASVAARASS